MSIGGVVAMAAPVEVFVKAAVGHPDQLGDCPFSQRVLLTLEEKGIPYNATFIDIENKPQWFLEANPTGKVPVIKDGDKFVADSDVITQLLEEKYPEPSLKTPPEYASVGAKLFPAFVAVLKSHDSSDGTKEAFLAEVEALDEHFKAHKPFIAGEKLTGIDLALAPKLYHATIAVPYYKNWSIPQQFTNLLHYIQIITSRESFKKTAASPELIIAGWDKHDGIARTPELNTDAAPNVSARSVTV